MAITTTLKSAGRAVTLDDREWGKAMHAVNEETGELEFDGQAVTWEQLAAAFAHRERTGIALELHKEEGKRLKLEDDEAQSALLRLGRRMRRARHPG